MKSRAAKAGQLQTIKAVLEVPTELDATELEKLRKQLLKMTTSSVRSHQVLSSPQVDPATDPSSPDLGDLDANLDNGPLLNDNGEVMEPTVQVGLIEITLGEDAVNAAVEIAIKDFFLTRTKGQPFTDWLRKLARQAYDKDVAESISRDDWDDENFDGTEVAELDGLLFHFGPRMRQRVEGSRAHETKVPLINLTRPSAPTS